MLFRRIVAALCALALALVTSAQAQFFPGFSPGFRPGFQFMGGAGGFPAPGAVVDYDWKNNRYSGPAITVSNASGGYVDDSAGNWTLVPPNTARRSNKGLLVEGAQTNSIRNSAMVGAALGQSQNAIRNNSMQGAVAGTPGTLPTNWGTSAANRGLSIQVVGTGTDTTTGTSVDYIEIRYFGTATSTGSLDTTVETAGTVTGTGVSSGSIWTHAMYVRLAAGSLNGATTTVWLSELGTGGSYLTGGGSAFSATGTLARYAYPRTLSNASVVSLQPLLSLGNIVSGTTYDFTLRIASPQLEQAPGAGPVTRTTGTAAAFAAGTLPTNWYADVDTANRQYSQVAGLGTENGIDYIDVRVFSQGNNGRAYYAIFPENSGGTGVSGAAAGQLWTISEFAKLLSANTSFTSTLYIRPSGASDLTSNVTLASSTAKLGQSRVSFSGTIGTGATGGLTGFVLFQGLTTTAPIDITIRIGWPQLEQWNTAVTTVGGASSPIRTTGTAATRAADVVTATLGSGLAASTLAVVVRNPTFQVKSAVIAQISDTGLTNNVRIRSANGTPTSLVGEPYISGAAQGAITIANGYPSDGTRHGVALAFQNADQAMSVDGAAPSTNTASTASNLNIITIGSGYNANPSFAYIERLAVYPFRAANSNLQQQSTLANWGG